MFLEVGKAFNTWLKNRICQYDFKNGNDFIIITEIGENPKGGRPASCYHLSIDMAKELAMIERNEKGKLARAFLFSGIPESWAWSSIWWVGYTWAYVDHVFHSRAL